MKILLTIFFIVGIYSIGIAQSNDNIKGAIGFACTVAGSPSSAVHNVSQLIYKADFYGISKLLDSKINAERYLAVLFY